MPTIEMTRKDLNVSHLRAVAARTADAKQARRILAIAMGLDGQSRRLAAPAGGIDRGSSPAGRFAKRGTRPRIKRFRRFTWAYTNRPDTNGIRE